jgi:hypothetical protein
LTTASENSHAALTTIISQYRPCCNCLEKKRIDSGVLDALYSISNPQKRDLDYLVPFVDFVFRLSLSRFTRPIETHSGNPPPLFLTVNMNDDRISDRIAFGSCNEQDLQNNLWPIIESRQPTAFVWGGDAIYADTLLAPDWSSFPPKAQHRCATPSLLRKLYQIQRNVPAYRSLLRQNLTVFGTFDGTCVGLTGFSPFVFESGRFLIWTLYSPYTRPRLRLQQCRSYVSIPIRKWYGLRGFFGLGFLLAHVSARPSWTWSIWSQAF